ncbi:MAG: hypothetical protein J7L96_08625 [Bacteroidales bacterium]|nr:hypothetical protein [Bacteroidales bacterium]
MRNISRLLILFIASLLRLVAFGQDQTAQPEKRNIDILSGDYDFLSFDTLTSGSQQYYQLYSQFPIWAELGNLGYPALPIKWTGNSSVNMPFFLRGFAPYLSKRNRLVHYYTNSPFALMNYNSGGTQDVNGQLIKVVFARPVAPGFRLSGFLDFITSPGHYDNQNAGQSSLTVNFSLDKPRYRIVAGIDRMQASLGENGGVSKQQDALGFYSNPRDVSINLRSAASRTGWTRIRGRQEYAIFSPPVADSLDSLNVVNENRPRRPVLVHVFNYQLADRYYKDTQSKSQNFYLSNYQNDQEAQDSAKYKYFDNRFGFSKIGLLADSSNWEIQAGLFHDLIFWRSNNLSGHFQDLGLYSMGSLVKDSWRIGARVNVKLLGYGIGNYIFALHGEHKLSESNWALAVDLSSESQKPDVFLQALTGNHDRWFQALSSQQEQSLKIMASNSRSRLTGGISLHAISNWIYFDTLATPVQAQRGTMLVSGELRKNFIAGAFRSNNYFLMQYTPVKEIPLPIVVASSSVFMHHDIHFQKTNGLLELEYGIDLRYCSAYQGFAYRPSTGAFFLQNSTQLGNYPYVDVFLLMRVKRTRIFIRYEHVNSDLTGGNYFPVLNYPVKKRFLKYGFYWHFYD